MLGDFVDRIYPIELEMMDTTYMSTSYLGLRLEIDNEGRLKNKPYDKGEYLNFPIMKFPFINMHQHSSSNCTWSIYLPVDPIFQSVWFLS